MAFTQQQKLLYERAAQTLAFHDLYAFVLTLWPVQIDTSRRQYVRYEELTGLIIGLSDVSDHLALFNTLPLGNLLMHLEHAILIAVHRAGLIQDCVRLREMNPAYIQFLFEDRSIGYAIEPDLEKIPVGWRDNLDTIFERKLIAEYFQRKTTSGCGNAPE